MSDQFVIIYCDHIKCNSILNIHDSIIKQDESQQQNINYLSKMQQIKKKNQLSSIFEQLVQLTEEQDQSKNQQVPQLRQQNQISDILQQDSFFKINSHDKSLLRYNQKFEPRLSLQQQNNKLLQDNHALLNECIRLTTLLSQTRDKKKGKKEQFFFSSFNSYRLKNSEQNQPMHELKKKIQQLEKRKIKAEKQISYLKMQNQDLRNSKGSSVKQGKVDSILTEESDRMISNIKIVYEAEIQQYKSIINDQNKKLKQLRTQNQYPYSSIIRRRK